MHLVYVVTASVYTTNGLPHSSVFRVQQLLYNCLAPLRNIPRCNSSYKTTAWSVAHTDLQLPMSGLSSPTVQYTMN